MSKKHYKHEIRKTAELIPYSQNSRLHSDGQIKQIASSIKEFGFTSPVLIEPDGGIVAGHGRVIAAEMLGLTDVPCIVVDGLTKAQKKAYVIADNSIALNSEWDMATLESEIDSLNELGFDLDLLALDVDFGELDHDEEKEYTQEELVNIKEEEKPIAKLGDIWQLDKHRLMCGDSTILDNVQKLLGDQSVDMVYTDPPYGINISGRGRVGNGSPRNGKMVKVNSYEPVKGDESIETALEAIKVINFFNPKVIILWGANHYANALPNSSCWVVWDKENTGNFADCELAWTNQKKAVRIFKHLWNGFSKASEQGENRVHPTQKPIALADWCISKYIADGTNVLDLFGGSGSTLLSCEKTNLNCFMIEYSEHYVDVIIQRWQKQTGKDAIHAESGQSYNDIKNKLT